MKTLILKSDRGSFEKLYIEHMQKKDVVTRPFYRNINEFWRYIMVLYLEKLRLPFGSFWYESWKKELKQFDTIILFDRNYSWNVIKYIHKKNPKCRIIIWYWNSLIKTKRIPKKYREYCEEWSFDKKDCQKYDLKYNVQFTFKELFTNSNKKSDIDVYFLGIDKGRSAVLEQLKVLLETIKKKSLFIVIKDKTSDTNKKIEYSKPISYELNLEYLSRAKCVAEIIQENQTGLSVRCLEAMFLQKKIITNNKELLNYSFYNANNIFMLNKEELNKEEIQTFLESPNHHYSDSDILQYDFENWLKNFDY